MAILEAFFLSVAFTRNLNIIIKLISIIKKFMFYYICSILKNYLTLSLNLE